MSANGLPWQAASFVGREHELAEIARLLADPGCRLLTLVGPGGIGKTRLAIEVIKMLTDDFANSAYFVNFQPVSSTEFLASTIADAINVPLSGQENPQVRLLDFLRNKTMLLLLDNFEHLLDGVDLLSEILQAAPDVRLLVTSREVLNLQEEWLYPVHGMHFPPTEDAARLEHYSAVQLFIERAQKVRHGFSWTNEQVGVVQVCQLVEGMPLAIELAAAWTKTLPCMKIASEIRHNLNFLASTLRNVPERHRSMQVVFEQTWKLLTEEERNVFSKLSVFRDGFRSEAAEQVANASLHTLSMLADKSLLTSTPNGRYQIHELLRQYAETQLQAFPKSTDHTRDLHCAYYTDFIHAHSAIHGGEQVQAVADLEAELENMRQAWQWAVEHNNVEAIYKMTHTLMMFYQYQSRYLEAASALEKASQKLESGQPNAALAVVLVNLGWLSLRLGQLEKAKAALEKSHTFFQTHNVPPPASGAGDPLPALSIVMVVLGDYAHAVELGQQAWRSCEARGDKGNLISCCLALASALLAQGNYPTAKQYAQKGCALAQELGHHWLLAYCLNQLGSANHALGDYPEARQNFQASYALRKRLNDAEGMAVALNHLGKLASLQEDYHEAKHLYQQSLMLYHDLGDWGGLATALAGLGMSACSLGEDQAARQYFHKALQTAFNAQLVPLALSVMVSIGELLLLTGQREQGIELIALGLYHAASDHETKDRAQHVLTRYEVAPEMLAETAQPVDFNATTLALLDDLALSPEMPVAISQRGRAEATIIETLSERELEVLRLIAEGCSNQDIANRLYVGVSTVKKHINHIYDKLDAKNRTQAVAIARERQILTD